MFEFVQKDLFLEGVEGVQDIVELVYQVVQQLHEVVHKRQIHQM